MQKHHLKFIFLILGFFLLGSQFTRASGIIGSSIITLTSLVINLIIFVIASIGSVFLRLGAFFLNWGIALNQEILVKNDILSVGFNVTLDLANLFFVLIIIIIAFATILRIESYGMKQTLWRLIVAALLINFSLVIAGLFIDFTGVITDFFINQATINHGDLATALTSAIAPQKVAEILNPSEIETIGGGFKTVMAIIMRGFFAMTFTLLAVIAVNAVAFMIFIRYVYLTILLILMPLAWLLWILPFYREMFSKWWDNFLRWIFFMPLAVFFLYLTVAIILQGTSLNPSQFVTNFAENDSDILALGGKMLAVIGLLIGGLIAANSLSITGAKIALNAAAGVKMGALGWAGAKIKKAPSFVKNLPQQFGKMQTSKYGIVRSLGRVGGTMVKGSGKLEPIIKPIKFAAKPFVQEGSFLNSIVSGAYGGIAGKKKKTLEQKVRERMLKKEIETKIKEKK